MFGETRLIAFITLEIDCTSIMLEACQSNRKRTAPMRLPVSLGGIVLLLISLACPALADECDAVAGELAARVPGVTIVRRSSVDIFVSYPSLKVVSIACLNKGKDRNLFVEAEGKFPGTAFFDFVGLAGPIIVGGDSAAFREGAIRCHKSALQINKDKDITFSYRGLSFQCSADKLSSSVAVEKQ
jgi:hypothetical protein